MSTVLHCLRYLESGNHRVHYGVRCDEDDSETIAMCARLKRAMPLGYIVDERPLSMGGEINRMAQFMPAKVYTVINDDILVLSPDWDDEIAKAAEETPHGVFWWQNALPQVALYPIVTERWRVAAGGIFTDHYPFWYDDLCLLELWMMTTSREAMILDIKIADKPKYTQRMRDLNFWQTVFTATRKMRVEQSYEIAAKLGLPVPQHPDEFARRVTNVLTPMSGEHLANIERNQGEGTTPPDARYIEAKAKAQALIDSLMEQTR